MTIPQIPWSVASIIIVLILTLGYLVREDLRRTGGEVTKLTGGGIVFILFMWFIFFHAK